MNSLNHPNYSHSLRNPRGFSLIEVVLAIGIFLVTVLALVGLLGPTLQSVDEVEKTDEVTSVVNTVNAFLQSSPDIAAPGESKFESIYEAVKDNNYATIFVYRYYYDGDDEGTDEDDIALEIGFASTEPVGGDARVNEPATNPADYANAAGPIYRVVLSASSVLPTPVGDETKYRDTTRTNGVYNLNADFLDYLEGYFAMEVRIFVRDKDMVVVTGGSMPDPPLSTLETEEPIFTYNTAVVR